MCEPMTLMAASMAVAGAQTVVGYSAAKAQANAQTKLANQNAANAATATERTYSNINKRIQQEGQAHAQVAQANEITTAQALASAEVAAGAGGVSGLSVDGVLRDIYAQSGRNSSAADQNLQMTRDYLQGEAEAAQSGGQSQINSIQPGAQPSATAFLLQGFSSGLNSYSNYLQQKES